MTRPVDYLAVRDLADILSDSRDPSMLTEREMRDELHEIAAADPHVAAWIADVLREDGAQ